MPTDRLRFRDIRNTSTFRLTLALGGIFTVGVVMLLGLIYILSARELNARSDLIIKAQVERFRLVPAALLPQAVASEIASTTRGLNYFALLTPRGRITVANFAPPKVELFDRLLDVRPKPSAHGPLRLIAIHVAGGATLLIARDISPIVNLRSQMLNSMIGSGIVILLAILVAAVALSLAPLRRLRDLQRACRVIAAGDLDARMPILGRRDELDLFAGTVNTMVDEVGRAMAQAKSVTDAIAHDLSTPMTRVRNQLYRIRQQAGVTPDVARRIDAATEDLDIVLERFAALLRISELEVTDRRAGFGEVMPDRLIASVCELYEPLAEERGIELSWHGAVGDLIHGDEQLLFEAVSNLLDNALKYTPPGGWVSVDLVQHEHGISIEIRDNGPGIPIEQRKAVFRRFQRGSGTEGIAGSGLGLSVVAAIVQLHQFSVELEDACPGLLVRLVCPQR